MSSRFLSRVALAIACVLGVTPTAAGQTFSPSVTVRVYDAALLDPRQRDAATATAADILSAAGVHSHWKDCTGDTATRRCHPARGAHDIILRIMPAGAATTDPTRGTIETRLRGASGILGFAILDPKTRTGALATIFLDPLLAVGERTRVPTETLLGRTIAHELGHLLLGSTGHARTGLMRELWTDEEFVRNRPEDWHFALIERDVLRGRRHEAAAASR